MTLAKEEAEPIARLLGSDRTRTVGWVYLWNTYELSILWIDEDVAAVFIEPPLRPEVLAKAKSATPVELADFFEALSTGDGEDPD